MRPIIKILAALLVALVATGARSQAAAPADANLKDRKSVV